MPRNHKGEEVNALPIQIFTKNQKEEKKKIVRIKFLNRYIKRHNCNSLIIKSQN